MSYIVAIHTLSALEKMKKVDSETDTEYDTWPEDDMTLGSATEEGENNDRTESKYGKTEQACCFDCEFSGWTA